MSQNLPLTRVGIQLKKIFFLVSFLTICLNMAFGNDGNKSTTKHSSYHSYDAAPSSTALTSSANPSCFGSTVTLTATVTPGDATGTVDFFDGATLLGTSAISGGIATFSTALLTPGAHSLTAVYAGDITYTASTSAALVQSVDAATPLIPAAILGGTPPFCSGSSQVFNVAAVTNATTYNWTVPAGWSITAGAGTTSITVTLGTSSGNITVTAGNACGASLPRTRAITVITTPAMPGTITGPATVCPSVTGLNYSIAAVPGATGYAWTSPGTGWTVTSGTNTVSITYSTTAAAVSGNILVAATNGGCSSAASRTININPANATDNTGYTDGITKFDDGITAATVTTPVRRGYIKFPTTALSVIPGTATVTSVLRLTNNASTGPSSSNAINGLGTNDPTIATAATLFNAVATGTPYFAGAWAGTGTTIATLNPTATAAILSSASSPGYIVMGLQRGTGAAVANFWGYSAGASAPVLAITYANIRAFAVTVSPPIPTTPGPITGPAPACPNTTGNVYSVPVVSGATTYTWTIPAGWTITNGAGTNAITVTSTGTGGSFSVTAGNSCGTSAPSATYAVGIGVLPTVNASPNTQETCSGLPIGTITCSNPNSVAGTTYSWTRDNVANTGMGLTGTTSSTITGTLTNILTTQQTSTFTINAVSGIGCISATPVTVTVSVNPAPVANAGLDQAGCAATAVPIGGTPTASGGTPGYGYLWSAGVSNTTIANPNATPGTYTVTVTDSKGCTSSDAVTVSAAGSGTKTWIGQGTSGGGPDNNFNNALNWSPAGVPGACNDVVINMDLFNIFNVFSGALAINLSASVTIKSLAIDIGGTTLFSSASNFKLYSGSNTLNILQTTSLNTHTSGFFSAPAGGYISVGPGGVISYGGTLTTLQSNNCTNFPFYADVNATGKMYLYGSASLAGIGNDPANKPGQIVFNGTGIQSISHNSGTQPIYLAATNTIIGETNSPTVFLTGGGANGFRNIGDLTINSGSTLEISANQTMNRNSAGGAITMAAGSFMKLGRSNGGVGSSNFPSNFNTFNFNATSTVDYNATTGQTVFATPLYGNLTISGAGNKTITGNTNVQNNITIQGGSAILQGGTFTTSLGGNWTNYSQTGFSEQSSTINFNGAGAQTINTAVTGEVYYTLNKTGAGTTTMLSNVAVQGGGTSSFTLSNGTFDAGIFTFNSATSTFNISAGLLKLAKVGVSLLPEFAISTYNLTGGTIELYGAGDQILRGSRDYRNLTFSTSGIKTVSSSIGPTNLITGTILTQNSVTLDVSNNTMGGAGTNLTMTGTSLYKTAGTGTKPDAQGVYTLNPGTTVEFTSGAATTEDVRLSPNYYNMVVSGTNVANPSLGTGIKFQAGGTFTIKNGGLFKLGNSTGFSGGAATSVANTNNPAIVLEDGSTVEYYGGPAGTNPQIVTIVMPYYHLNFSGSSIKTAPATILTVKGNFSNMGSALNHSNGTLLLNGITAQNYNSTGTVLNWYNLNAVNPVNINVNGDLGVERLLSLGTTGKLNFNTGYLSLRSNATNTAGVDKINVANSITYGGAGRFIVERYIPTGLAHGKTWQFLSTPAFGHSVNASWQEGNAPLVVGTSGFGTTLSSEKVGAVSRGYDFYTAPGPSIKSYNDATNGWNSIDDGTTPTTSLQLANNKGYMIFVRGDRSVQTSATAANATTFRTIGKLYAPGTDAPASIAVGAAKFGSIGNPYASAIDFTNVAGISTGIDSKYYVWDPLLAGTLGYGGYQVLSSSTGWVPTPGGTTNYPSGIPYTKIQSGQAFFVYSTPGGTVNFDENNKIAGSQMVYREAGLERQFFRTYLYNAAGTLADGNTVVFDQSFTADVNADDALKINNTAENFGILQGDKVLSVDAREQVTGNDTLFYNINNLYTQNYRLKLVPEHMGTNVVDASFIDKFTGTSTPVSLSDSSVINFSITADPASAAADRFYIVFRALGPVPVKLVNVSAVRTDSKNVNVSWKVDNEINTARYELERSDDGQNFNRVNTATPKLNNGGSAYYYYTDEQAPPTGIFYRVRCLGSDGQVQVSNIVKVGAITAQRDITVYPNPVADRFINIFFINQEPGDFNLRLINNLGQVVYNRKINVTEGTISLKVPLGDEISFGNYQLRIIAPDGVIYTKNLIIK